MSREEAKELFTQSLPFLRGFNFFSRLSWKFSGSRAADLLPAPAELTAPRRRQFGVSDAESQTAGLHGRESKNMPFVSD